MKKILLFVALLPSGILFSAFIILLILYTRISFIPSFFGILMFGWMISVVFSLQSNMPKELKKSNILFKINSLYMFLVLAYQLFKPITISYIQIPVYLFCLFSFFYCLYYVSWSLVTVEEKKYFSFDRYIGTIFLFWFIPIGIWFLKPRIKKALHEN